MRTMKKMLFATVAAGTLAAVCAASALCAQLDVTSGATYNKDANGKYTVSVDASKMLTQKNGQMTVLITKAGALEAGLTDSDILYIDQLDGATTNLFQNMGVKGALEEGKTYDVFVGGENVTSENQPAFYRTSFTVGANNTIKWCDINEDGAVNADDVTRLLLHTTGNEPLSYTGAELLKLADINKDDTVNADDVTRLLLHTTGNEPLEGLNY